MIALILAEGWAEGWASVTLGNLLGGGGAAVVLVGLPRFFRVLRWCDEIGKQLVGLVGAVRTDVDRRARVTLKAEAWLDHWLTEHEIEVPVSTGKVRVQEVREAVMQRIAEKDTTGVISLIEHMDPAASSTAVREIAAELEAMTSRLNAAIDKRESTRKSLRSTRRD